MPQLILLIVVLAIGWYGYRRFLREAERVNERARKRREEARTGSSGTLVQDPETGEYRLEKD